LLEGFEMSEPLIWVLIAVAFGLVEIFTLGLTTIWFAIGAVAACLVALMGGPFPLQIFVFFAVSIVLLCFTKPLADKKLKVGHEKNFTDQMIGKTCLVTETIRPYRPGQVKLDGMYWRAVSNEEKDVLEKGTLIKIVKLEGVKLVVESCDEAEKGEL